MPDYLPRRELDRVHFTARLAERLLADPVGHAVSPEAAAEYAAAQQQFAQAVHLAGDPATRTGPAIRAKRTISDAFIEQTRELVGWVRANIEHQPAGIGKLAQIGLREDGRQHPRRTPLPLPEPPTVRVTMGDGWSVRLHVYDLERIHAIAKPRGIVAAAVMYCVAASPLPLIQGNAWHAVGAVTRTRLVVPIKAKNVSFGDRLWFIARWINTRYQTTAWSAPACVRWACELPRLESRLTAA